MKPITIKRLGVGFGAFLFLLALVAFVPGFEFSAAIPGVISADKTSNVGKQGFEIGIGTLVAKYEINYGAVEDPCWGPEGFSTAMGFPYFRWGTLELSAWHEP
ncbi:MAG: hypothetical protein V4675_19535 [Verrucomicrobiota bacterium]